MFSDTTLAYAEDLTTALLGVDALYRAEQDGDADGLVVLNMSTMQQPEPFGSYAAAQTRFAGLGAHRAGAAPGVPALCVRPHALAAERGAVRLSGGDARKGGVTFASQCLAELIAYLLARYRVLCRVAFMCITYFVFRTP